MAQQRENDREAYSSDIEEGPQGGHPGEDLDNKELTSVNENSSRQRDLKVQRPRGQEEWACERC